MNALHPFDLLVIAGYFVILFGIGYWAARREKNVSADYETESHCERTHRKSAAS